MIGFGYYMSNVIMILKKHKLLSFLMITFVFICLLLLGTALNMRRVTEKNADEYNEAYGEKDFFYTGEALSDIVYYRYLEDNNHEDFQKLLNFKNKLTDSASFLYTEIIEQSLELINHEIPEIFRAGYEQGGSSSSVYEYEGNKIYAAKAIEVSNSFFNEFSIKISAGNIFSEEDYLLNDDQEIPMLAGSAYKEILKIGDKLEGYYLLERKNFVVQGFIEEQSFFYSRSNDDFVSCERYMIVPSFKLDQPTKFSKLLLLQQMTGMISSTLGYEKTLEIYNQYLQEAGIEAWQIYILNPNAKTSSIFDTYSAMTNEVAQQFNIIVIILLAFGCMAMISVLCGMLRENHFVFGVSLLCGASFKNIALETIGLVGSILLIGDLFASFIMLLQKVAIISFLIVQVSVIVITIASCAACILYLKQMDISDIIGGKE